MLQGPHKDVFSYRPSSFFIGLLISLGRLAIACQAILSGWRSLVHWRLVKTGGAAVMGHLCCWRKASEAVMQHVMELRPKNTPPLSAAPTDWLRAASVLICSTFRNLSLDTALLVLTLMVYLSVRLIGLERFPIFFFCDEAIQVNLAADLLRDGFHNYDGTFLPTYFRNDRVYSLGVSVYLQVLPYLAFGKSPIVARSTVAILSVLAALGIGLTLKWVFKTKHWYLGIVLLSTAPAWFLHSRVAFEYAVFVSFYSLFLLFYLLYRYRSANYIYAALISAALAFYSYSPGQFITGVTIVVLALSDLAYHWRNRKLAWRVGTLAFVLALPYLRFRIQSPFSIADHLRALGSYWMEPISLTEKLGRYFVIYGHVISPGYWFGLNEGELQRHLMKGYGHLWGWGFPFFVLGVLKAAKNVRCSAYRCLLLVTLAAPTGSALVGAGVGRTLVFVVPATLLATLGISEALHWLEFGIKRAAKAGRACGPLASEGGAFLASALSIGILGTAIFANVSMLRDALVNGPLWFRDYGLGQMQWGAFQIFDRVQAYIRAHPGTRVIFSPTWANGTDTVARFFLGDPMPVQMGTIDGHLHRLLPLDDRTGFVMTPPEYERARASGKFEPFVPEEIVPYPDGTPGFYFARVKYVSHVDEIMASEREARRQLDSSVIQFEGRQVLVKHSRLDMGTPQAIFDGNWETVARTFEANPFVVELELPEPRQLCGLSMKIGSVQPRVTVLLFRSEGGDPVRHEATLKGSIDKPTAVVQFPPVDGVKRIRIELYDPNAPEPTNVHLWEVQLLPS